MKYEIHSIDTIYNRHKLINVRFNVDVTKDNNFLRKKRYLIIGPGMCL